MKCFLAAGVMVCSSVMAEPPSPLDACNVVWSSPSRDASGSMPTGNGEVGLNAWVEPGGDLVFYISRVDSWSECERLLKIGRVRVTFDPPLPAAAADTPFRQELVLKEGCIAISAGAGRDSIRLALYVDATSPVVVLQGRSESPRSVRAAVETWRESPRVLDSAQELQSAWAMRDAPPEVPRELLTESADVVLDEPDAVAWYHRNEHSIVPFTIRHQGLQEIAAAVPDPLLHRTFGGWMVGPGMKAAGRRALHSSEPVREFQVRIAVPCGQFGAPGEWATAARSLAGSLPADSKERTESWWRAFWERSWVYVENDRVASGVPRNKHPLRIGADSNTQNLFRGKIGRASMYGAPMSAGDIASMAAAGPAQPNPVEARRLASWRFHPSAPDGGPLLPDGDPSLAAVRVGDVAYENEDGQSTARFRGGHFEVKDQESLALGDGFSIEAWIEPEERGGPARIIDKMTAGTSDGFIFDTHPGDALRLICGDVTLTAPGALKQGRWQHVAATFDAVTGRAALYADGKVLKETGGASRDALAPSRTTQAYTLQRFMLACASRGDFPVKFNGSIFTVEPAHVEGQPFNADWRKWGGSFWWQNTRLPYYPMLAAGDFDGMNSLFSFYERSLPACRDRAGLYYKADGVYFPETMTTFASYANGDYGWKREGLAASDISPCPWWQWAWQQGLELSQIMLDYASYTGDAAFLRDRALPMAGESLRFYDTRFGRDGKGKLVISPTQAVETYWKDVVNDAPSVAGLHAVCDALLSLPGSAGSAEDRALWKRVKDAAPALPVLERDGITLCAPAEKYDPQRSNCETPELYALFPFRLYGVGRPNLDRALAAYQRRADRATHGWTQDGMFAAMLGLADEAKANLLAKCRNSNRNFRFPAMWGPNFDWLPDQDHGSNLMTTTQLMLMQCYDDKIYLLPAWPREWNVSFKLHAPRQTTVECVYRDGAVSSLTVTPASRRADVVMPAR